MTLIRLIVALVITLIVPAAGFLMSGRIIWEINLEMQNAGAPSFDELCAMPDGEVDRAERDFIDSVATELGVSAA